MITRRITGTSRQPVAVTVAANGTVLIFIDGAFVGHGRHVGQAIVPADGAELLPRLGEATRAEDCALYEALEKALPPAPTMPGPGVYRGHLVEREAAAIAA